MSHALPVVSAQVSDLLYTRLLKELKKIKAPDHVFELVYGIGFFSLAATGEYAEDVAKDYPSVLISSLQVLEQTGGMQ